MPTIFPASGHVDPDRREHWRPKLRAGYFFVKDRQYYLFARKRTIYVRDAMELRQELAGIPVEGTMSVKIEGIPWDNWWIEGRDLVISLLDIAGQAAYWAELEWDISRWDFFKTAIEALPENQVEISYDYLDWNDAPAPTGQKFDVNSITQVFQIGDAERTYHLPDDYVSGSPVVITDDSKWFSDGRDHRLQFRITEPRRSIEFNMYENVAHNPHFHRGMSGVPAAWYITDPTGFSWVDGTGYVMDRYLRAYPTGRAVQEVPVTGNPWAFEVWIRGSGQALLELAYKSASGLVDQYGANIGWDPDFGVYSHRVTGLAEDSWTRLSTVVGDGTEFDPTDALFPDICDAVEVRLGALSGYVEFGAVQVRNAPRAALYNYVDPTGTIEYETDPSGFWRLHPRDRFPWEAEWDADMNAVNQPASEGFLVIAEEGEPVDENLGIGQLTWDDPAPYGSGGAYPDGYPRGLLPWPSGVRHEFGRRHLPYAKTRGYQKLRQTQTFDLENQPPALFEVTEPRRPRDAAYVIIGSPASMYRSSGRTYLVLHSGQARSEFMSARFLDVWQNAMIHDWIEILPSGQISVDPSGAYTDDGGRVSTYIAYASGEPVVNPPGIQFRHRDSGRTGSILIDIV